MSRARRSIAERLRFLADRISPEDSWRRSHLRLRHVQGVGSVVDQGSGVPLWYRADEYEAAHLSWPDGTRTPWPR